jgi:hypothetical protein
MCLNYLSKYIKMNDDLLLGQQVKKPIHQSSNMITLICFAREKNDANSEVRNCPSSHAFTFNTLHTQDNSYK